MKRKQRTEKEMIMKKVSHLIAKDMINIYKSQGELAFWNFVDFLGLPDKSKDILINEMKKAN